MKINKYIFIFFSCFLPIIARATEVEYESFGGRTISDNSSLGEYVAFYFNFLLIIAAGAAFLIIIFAGINYLISGDNFVKRITAKKMIFNALFGLLIALGSITILNTINPSRIIEDTLEDQKYNDGINLIKQDNNKNWANDNIYKTTEEYVSVEWLSPKEDLLAIYVFNNPNFEGTSVEIPNGSSGVIPANSSIWFSWAIPGAYNVYDDKDYKLKNKALPLSSTKDKEALSQDIFDDVAQSIKIFQPDDNKIRYGLILFTESDYRGTCSWTLNDIPDLDISSDQENNPFLGIDKLSSLKRIKTNNSGAQITIYNRINCKQIDTDPESKKCTINNLNENLNIKEKCPEFEGEVLSINFDTDNAGALLKSNNNNCQFFEKLGNNNCISLIKYGYTYDADNKISPTFLTLFSLDK